MDAFEECPMCGDEGVVGQEASPLGLKLLSGETHRAIAVVQRRL